MKNKDVIKEISKGDDNACLEVISLGMGVQSTAMYLMSSIGLLPKADYAIFSDTGAEHNYTYKYLSFLEVWANENDGVPIIVTNSNPDLYTDIISNEDNLISIPAFVKYEDGNSIISRSCTNNYKITPIYKKIRELVGLKKYERTKKLVNVWIGISLDELKRASISHNPITVNKYPLLYNKLTRQDCITFFKDYNFPVPRKSSCVFCPYQSDKSILDMKREKGDDWDKAVEIDKAIRKRFKTNKTAEAYLHNSRVPLEDVSIKGELQGDLFENECAGHCGL